MKQVDDTIIFETTGRQFYAYYGCIAINEELEPKHGFDGEFPADRFKLNKKERIELADYMIELWNKFKEV